MQGKFDKTVVPKKIECFRRVHQDLNETVKKFNTDLVVIEGMGRALHTNFNVQFKCDSLKVGY